MKTLLCTLLLCLSTLGHATLRLDTHGDWPRTWTDCTLTDPQDFHGTRAFVGTKRNPNPWPRVPVGWYTSIVSDGAYTIAECGDELCLATGPDACNQTIVAQKTALNRKPGDFFRAWSWVAGPEGLTGLGGVSCGPYGAPGTCSYPIHRITAPTPESDWTLSPGPVAGLSGVSTSGAPMSLVRLPSGELWYYPTVVFAGKTGFGFARSTDRGATWQGYRNGAAWVDLRPAWMQGDSWVFSRAVLLNGRVHLWLTRWRKSWAAGQAHLVSEDGVTFTNYYPGSTLEFGNVVVKGMIPFSEGPALRGIVPHGLGVTATFGGLL